MSKERAIREVAPDEPLSTWKQRLTRYRSGGWQALVNRNRVGAARKVSPEVVAVVRGLLEGNPELRSEALCAKVNKVLGISVQGATMRKLLRDLGLAHRPGPPGPSMKAEPLPLAGAELLKGAEADLGAVARLTADIEAALEALPDETGPVLDDRANRDERGRFLASYNEGQAKGEADLGPKFETVDIRRQGRDLSAMRTANSSYPSLFRKALALTLFPCVLDTPRPDGLRHWQGEHLAGLVGVAYMPETLLKFMRELKLAGVADAMRESAARFWMTVEGPALDPVTGAVVLYADTTTKPIWTHHFSRSTPVAKLGGRVMPAMSTVMLHSGTGTPLVYRTFSGTVSLPDKTMELIREYEAAAGEATVKRLLVMDREGHAIEYIKKLQSGTWLYIVPLRSNVLGPNAQFDALTEWAPYGEQGDEVREGRLLLHDRRKGEGDLWVRVVARKRHRTGKEAWYATNAPQVEFPPPVILDRYFDRWPLQEHRFRDAYGRVGLHVHHGFGKELVANIAVLDRIEQLEGRLRRLERARDDATTAATDLSVQAAQLEEAVTKVAGRIAELRSQEDADVAVGRGSSKLFVERHALIRSLETWHHSARQRLDGFVQSRDEHVGRASTAESTIERVRAEADKLSRRRQIYTVDTELDEIMTAFKLTFVNLCMHLMKRYLGAQMELDTLIQAVLTLPGERTVTRSTETVRIYRHDRDRKVMPLVETACRLLTEKRLMRNKRRLIYEVVDRPSP